MYANLFASLLPKTWVTTHLPAQLVVVPLQATLKVLEIAHKQGFNRNLSSNWILKSLEKNLQTTPQSMK